MQRSQSHRFPLLVAAIAAIVVTIATGALPAGAGADISVPGWRNFAATGEIDVEPGRAPSPDIELVSRRGGNAGIDQVLTAPPKRVVLRITGHFVEGEGQITLEWVDAAGEVLDEVTRPLDLDQGRAVEAYDSPANSAELRVAVIEDAESVLRLDSIELLGPRRDAVLNPDLRPRGCPTDNTTPVIRYGVERVPGWKAVEAETAFEVLRWRRGRSPPIRVITPIGYTGLVQFVDAPAEPVRVEVAGTGSSAADYLVVAWRVRPSRADPSEGLLLAEHEYPLDLGGDGTQNVAVAPPSGAEERLVLQVAVVQRRPGTLALDRIEARTPDRTQLLDNRGLTVPICPIPPQPPPAANSLSPPIRWATTAYFALLATFLLVGLWRRREDDAVDPGPSPSQGLRIAFLAAIALMPFVSVGTLRLQLRVIPADWIFFGLAILLLSIARYRSAALSDRARILTLVSVTALTLVTGVSLVLSQIFYSDQNLAGLTVGNALVADIGSPLERGIVDQLHLVQGLAAIFATLALVSNRAMWLSAVRVVVISGAVVGAYGVYQVAAQAALGTVPQPPGAFPTAGLRASGPFPEPTAYAGFLVFAAACAMALIEIEGIRKLPLLALLPILGGAVASRSPIAVAGLVLLALVLIIFGRIRSAATLAVPAVLVGVLIFTLAPSERWREAFEKPLGVSNSVLDREVVWSAAWEMGDEYAPAGVGRGQFAFNQAPFVDPDDADRGGRVSSAILELWAEAGPLGILFAAAAALAGPLLLLRRSRSPQAVPFAAGASVIAIWLTFVVVMAVYYTTQFVWIWFAIGLVAATPRALARASPPIDAMRAETDEAHPATADDLSDRLGADSRWGWPARR